VTCGFGNIPARWCPAGSIRGDASGVRTRALPRSPARRVCCERVRSGGHDTKAGVPPYLGLIHRPPSCSGIHGGAGSRAGTRDTAGGGENGSAGLGPTGTNPLNSRASGSRSIWIGCAGRVVAQAQQVKSEDYDGSTTVDHQLLRTTVPLLDDSTQVSELLRSCS
jgi:hypothetical protein